MKRKQNKSGSLKADLDIIEFFHRGLAALAKDKQFYVTATDQHGNGYDCYVNMTVGFGTAEGQEGIPALLIDAEINTDKPIHPN